MPGDEESPYAARPAPASFDDFMAQVSAIQEAHGGLMVDEDLYEDIFGEAPSGARPDFIKNLPRPSAAEIKRQETTDCPVCLQSLAAIETEEEYALADEAFFGDLEALGLRRLPCDGKHVVCARCCKSWLKLNNSCPLCRAVVDPQAPVSHHLIDQQRHTEQMLSLFHAVFGQRGPGGAGAPQQAGPGAMGSFPGIGQFLGGRGLGGEAASSRPNQREREEDRSAFSGMYS